MERQSDKHGPRLDDAMEHEVESLTHGAPIESRVDPGREMEDAADDEPYPEGIIEEIDPDDEFATTLPRRDVRARSDLAVHLRPSIFPATAEVVLACAQEEGAPPDLIEALMKLPWGATFHTTEEVWEALGGHTEHRPSHLDAPTPSAPIESAPTETTPIESTTPTFTPTEPAPAAVETFGFRFDTLHRLLGLPFGVVPELARVEVDRDADRFVARFGPWRVDTPLHNVEHATITHGYFTPKTIGPARLSVRDRGLTFATNDAAGVCICFHEPVKGIDPAGVIRHPALTVTVDDTEGLVAALT